MTRNSARKAIIKAIEDKYGDAPMAEVIASEGWDNFAYHAISEGNAAPLPKKMLEFAGLEIVKIIDYRRKV